VPESDGTRTELEWAWEIHKNCDQLLHQRLAAFITAQAMTVAGFMTLTIARFQPGLSVERALWIDGGRYALIIFGFVLALAAMAVSWPMYRRLQFLNNQYMRKLEVFDQYLNHINGPIRYAWYRLIIPFWLPLVEMIFWAILFLLVWTAPQPQTGGPPRFERAGSVGTQMAGTSPAIKNSNCKRPTTAGVPGCPASAAAARSA
jgi:hypothetical protein